MIRSIKIISLFLLATLVRGTSPSQTVLRPPESIREFTSRWNWAREEAIRWAFNNGYWVAYEIKKPMGRHSFIGSFHSDRKKNSPTLGDVISRPAGNEDDFPTAQENLGNIEGTFSFNDEKTDPVVIKEVAILFHYSGKGNGEIDEAVASNLSLHVDLYEDPIFWLGSADNGESIDLLTKAYSSAPLPAVRKKIIAAVANHPPSDKTFQFLKSILLGTEAESIREDAAFWLGESNDTQAIGLLEQTARQDRSEVVREKAVFAISQAADSGATESLIRLATREGDQEMRKKATFWLGQKAGRKAVASLRDMAMASDDVEIEKSALFALSQLPDNAGVEPLIGIARKHINREIRKQAIFWLSQCEDPRAIEAIIQMVRN
jgi:hypothetical protein